MEATGSIPTVAGHLRDEKATGVLHHSNIRNSSTGHRSSTMATTVTTATKLTLMATLGRITETPTPNKPTMDEVNPHHNSILKIIMRQRRRRGHEYQTAEAGSILLEEEEVQFRTVEDIPWYIMGNRAQAVST